MELRETSGVEITMVTETERIAVLETKVAGAETVVDGIGKDVKEIRKDLHKIALSQSMLLGGLIVVDIVARYLLK